MVRMNLEFVDRKITSELFKIWPKNDQVGHHMLTYLLIAQPDFAQFRWY